MKKNNKFVRNIFYPKYICKPIFFICIFIGIIFGVLKSLNLEILKNYSTSSINNNLVFESYEINSELTANEFVAQVNKKKINTQKSVKNKLVKAGGVFHFQKEYYDNTNVIFWISDCYKDIIQINENKKGKILADYHNDGVFISSYFATQHKLFDKEEFDLYSNLSRQEVRTFRIGGIYESNNERYFYMPFEENKIDEYIPSTTDNNIVYEFANKVTFKEYQAISKSNPNSFLVSASYYDNNNLMGFDVLFSSLKVIMYLSLGVLFVTYIVFLITKEKEEIKNDKIRLIYYDSKKHVLLLHYLKNIFIVTLAFLISIAFVTLINLLIAKILNYPFAFATNIFIIYVILVVIALLIPTIFNLKLKSLR